MMNGAAAWWQGRSRRSRRVGVVVALLLLVGLAFWAGSQFAGRGSGAAWTPGPSWTAGPSESGSPTASAGESAGPSSSSAASTSPASTPRPSPKPTPTPTPRPTPTSTTPAAPLDLKGKLVGKHQVDLTWSASAGAVSYNVWRGPKVDAIVRFQSGILTTSYKDSPVTTGKTYYYRVTAVGPTGAESAPSAIFEITP